MMQAILENDLRNAQRLASNKQSNASAWELDIVTCEYPPSVGGVADYTKRLAQGLREAGIAARVWAPREGVSEDADDRNVRRSLGKFGPRSLYSTGRLMGKAQGQAILLQWEPVGYGLKSLNVPFCLWIASRVLQGSKLLVMFHETFLPLSKRTLKRSVAGTLQRLMAFTLANCAGTVFVSNGGGAAEIKNLCLNNRKVRQMPVFSNIEGGVALDHALAIRSRIVGDNEVLLGHFGRYMAKVEVLVLPVMAELLRNSDRVRVLFVGECGERYREALRRQIPEAATRITASGVGAEHDVACHIAACDAMFQPYPGGVTTKRSSTMAALVNGKCVITNRGTETEDIWNDCPAIHFLAEGSAGDQARQLLNFVDDVNALAAGSSQATSFYEANFSVRHTVQMVLSSMAQMNENVSEVAVAR